MSITSKVTNCPTLIGGEKNPVAIAPGSDAHHRNTTRFYLKSDEYLGLFFPRNRTSLETGYLH